MKSKEKKVSSHKFIFGAAIVFYILSAVLAIAVFSSIGVFVGYRLPPVYNFLESATPIESKNTAAGRQVVGSVTSLNGVSYEFDVPEEEPQKSDEVPEEEEPAWTDEVPEEIPPSPETHFYSFTSINSTTILHMRKEPSMDSAVIAKLKPGTKGYVMEPGDDWSRVWADNKIGYCSNEFLSLTEISKEEIPEEAIAADEAFITGDAQ